MQEDWQTHLEGSDTIFFSPFVVDVVPALGGTGSTDEVIVQGP